MSTFSGLSIGISGLYANKKALDTTSHNIANANNPYYVRQQVIQATGNYTTTPSGKYQIGTGVNIQEIRQIRDEFLDTSFRDYSQNIGSWSSRSNVLDQVQEIFNEITDNGLQKVMDQFWNAWEELSKRPDNLTIRGLLKERSVAFVETVKHLSKQLDNLQVNLNRDIRNKVDEINNIGSRLAKLNTKIKKIESTDIKANDLRDERNSLLDRLSELVNIEYYEDDTSAVNVSIGGKQIVNGDFFTELITKLNGTSFYDVHWSDNNEKVNIKNGELFGLINARGDVASTILSKNNGTVNDNVEIRFLHNNEPNIPTLFNDFKTDFNNRGFDNLNSDIKDVTGNTFNNVTDIINYIKSDFSTNENNKNLIIVSNSDIANPTKQELDILKSLNVSITVIGDSLSSANWSKVVNLTSGKLFDISNVNAIDLSQETSNIVSGQMGNVASFEQIIPTIKQKLNTFVNTIARNINYLHNQGFTLDQKQGTDFFISLNGDPIQADNIDLNPNLFNLNNISVSSNGDLGNGFIAEQIVDLREKYIFGNLNSDGFYRDIISDIGVEGNRAKSMEQSTRIVRDEVDLRRKSISGVSLDEEMADMLKYQHSYIANSRVINAIDEMIENIINKVGLVGR